MAIFDARNTELLYERLCILHFMLCGELVAVAAGKAVVQKSGTIQTLRTSRPQIKRPARTKRAMRESVGSESVRGVYFVDCIRSSTLWTEIAACRASNPSGIKPNYEESTCGRSRVYLSSYKLGTIKKKESFVSQARSDP